jgi:hypothetical protein
MFFFSSLAYTRHPGNFAILQLKKTPTTVLKCVTKQEISDSSALAEALFMFKNNPYLSIKIARPGDLVAVRPELRNSTVSLMGSPTDCRTRSEEADGHYWLACSENVVVYFFFLARRAL